MMGVSGGRFPTRRGLVTGGASGIGLAVAKVLLAEGAYVVLLDIDRRGLDQASTSLGCPIVQCDISDEAQVRAAVGTASEAVEGEIDLLVNAAGVYRITPLLEIESKDWGEVLDVNLRGTFLTAKEVVAGLRAAERGGSVVNVASTAAFVGDATEPAGHYNASKGGVLALTRQMAVEWARYRVRVNAVCPGLIDTPMLRLMDDPERGGRYLDARVPLRRLGTAEEVAEAVLFLSSGAASYITGAALTVDGGATAL
jgi:NAD(P)-dependent dehydrogenase (short-subunit alcohol dehydrogenase family)